MLRHIARRQYPTAYKSGLRLRPFQTRLVSGGATAGMLAQREQVANRDPQNPAIQADFYKVLMENNYPHVVVSRFDTPGIASNAECSQIYNAAVRQLSGSTGNPGGTGGSGQGTRRDPVHVVVTESAWSSAARWVKWLVPVALVTYGAIQGFNYLVENSGVFRGAGVEDKAVDVTESNVKFSDVCGVDEARAELEEIVEFLKDPAKFTGLGGKLPKGVLLTGPPGTGKTLLARATAGEAGVPFFFMSGSEFDELYVGVGAKRVRELFNQARARAPAIIFIDELDAVGGRRNPKDQAYAKQTLNQLLVELDGFAQTEGVVVIGATNFPESLDKALTRPGRFDKEVVVELPDVRGRIEIIKHHLRNISVAPDVDPKVVARGTPGLSGAELMNLVNQAAVHASQQNALAVGMRHMEWAKDKVLLGAARHTLVQTDEARKLTAYHEAGHAIAALYTPGATPLYKATILPRGRALGVTFQLPEMDKHDLTRKECVARLDVAMGGRVAEQMMYGPENTTSGCSSDLAGATSVARAMVTQYGMSEAVGPIRLADDWDSWSARLRDKADEEVRDMLIKSEDRTKQLLECKKTELSRLAEGLLQYETLSRDEMEKIVRGELLAKDKVIPTVVKAKQGIPLTQ